MHDTANQSFGAGLKKRRIQAVLTQARFAELAGFSVAHIYKLERRLTAPKLATLEALAQALGLRGTEYEDFLVWALEAGRAVPDMALFPVPLTTLVGREREVTTLTSLLDTNRLVTITGTAGVGKTHLALYTANTIRHRFRDGAFFIDLTSIYEENLLIPAIAAILEIEEQPDQSLQQTLIATIKHQRQLWVLDNFEQLVRAAPLIGEILKRCDRLTILITSRIALHLRGEQEFPLAPLAVPGSQQQLVTDEILKLLESKKSRLITLIGADHISQNRLAYDIAVCSRPHFAHQAITCNGADVQNDEDWLNLIADQLGNTMTLQWQALAKLLYDQHILLILTNALHHAMSAESIAFLHMNCPHLFILTTHHAHPLGLPEETVIVVPEMMSPNEAHLVNPKDAQDNPAITLFLQRAKAANPDFRLTPTKFQAIIEICRRLNGLPLALELAAARSKLLSPIKLRQQLEDALLEVLIDGAGDLPEHQRTMRGTIDWSYQLLTPREQQRFRLLSVFSGGATLRAIQAICDTSAHDTELDADLAAIVASNLVYLRDIEENEPRYTMLEIIREFGQEQLLKHNENRIAWQRFGSFYGDMAERAEEKLTSDEQKAWIMHLTREHANIRAVLRWTQEDGDRETGLALASAIRRYWEVGGHISEGRAWLEALLKDREQMMTPAYTRALYVAAYLAQQQGDLDEAERLGNLSLQMEQQAGNQAGEAQTLALLSTLATNRGDHEDAFQKAKRSLALHTALNNTKGIATTLHILGYIAHYQAKLSVAVAMYQQSLTYTMTDAMMQANTKSNLGNVFRYQGNYAKAEMCYQEAFECYQQLNNRLGIARVRYNQGCLALWEGEWKQAKSYANEALALRYALQDKRGQALGLLLLAEIAFWQEEVSLAQGYLTQVQSLKLHLKDVEIDLLLGVTMGKVALAQHKALLAQTAYYQAIPSLRKINDLIYAVEWVEYMAHIRTFQEKNEEALRLYALAKAQRSTLNAASPPIVERMSQFDLQHLRASLGDGPFTILWEQRPSYNIIEFVTTLPSLSTADPLSSAAV